MGKVKNIIWPGYNGGWGSHRRKKKFQEIYRNWSCKIKKSNQFSKFQKIVGAYLVKNRRIIDTSIRLGGSAVAEPPDASEFL